MAKSYYIKMRNNPQLGVYYVKMGQMTKKDARSYEKSKYGRNKMMEFKTEEEYLARIRELESSGEKMQ